MADEFFCTVNEYRVSKIDVYAPWTGAWYADVVLDDGDATLSGLVTITIGTLRLVGTIDPATSGSFVLQRHFRVVAGAGQWGKRLGPENYYLEPTVSRQSIAADLARETGETLAAELNFPGDDLGPHFVRRAGLASLALERLASPGKTWWIDQLGVTHVGTRPLDIAEPGTYQTLNYTPTSRTAEIGLDDPVALWVGSIIDDRFDEPKTIRDLEIHVEGSTCRVRAFLDDASDSTRLSHALDALFETREQRFYGTYRYRVYSDSRDNTLNLQVVRPVSGLPDVLPVSIATGLAGARTKLDEGEIVKVAFDEGDITMPFVAHYPPGDPEKTAGLARMADLTLSGGALTTIMFSTGPEAGAYVTPVMALGSPSGVVPVVVPGVRYLVSFGSALDIDPAALAPPTLLPPQANPLVGYVASASDRNETE